MKGVGKIHKKPSRYNKSKYKGVTWHKTKNNWHVYINHYGKRKFVGTSTDEDEAGIIYNKAVDNLLNGNGYKNVIGIDNRDYGEDLLLKSEGLLMKEHPSGLFLVLENGVIARNIEGRIVECYQNKTSRGKRYSIVSLSLNGKQKHFYVHRLVAETFIPNPKSKPQVNHIDGNPSNNHYSNLEWCTNSENIQHAWDMGLIKK